jgi:hypothetical protein
VIDMERVLFDLAEHLDCPTGENLAEAVRDRISVPIAGAETSRRRVRTLLTIAAVIVAIVAAVVAVAPARHAIADWLGIGAVEIRVSDHPLPTGPKELTVPGAPGPARAADTHRRLDAAQRAVPFTIATPSTAAAGELAGVELDRRVRGGLVVLRYPRFTLGEIGTYEPALPLGKLVGTSARAQRVTVAGRPGLWIAGAHEIGYLDRSGAFQTDTVRVSGPVLLWERAGVTYRIEGFSRLADAQQVARSVR